MTGENDLLKMRKPHLTLARLLLVVAAGDISLNLHSQTVETEFVEFVTKFPAQQLDESGGDRESGRQGCSGLIVSSQEVSS